MSNFKTLKRRGFALFLAIVMVVALLPFSAFATLNGSADIHLFNVENIADLNEAIALCNANDEQSTLITLTGEIVGNIIIPADKNIQLNLNGHTLTGVPKADSASGGVNTTLTNYGTLSIIGSGDSAITRPCDGYVIDNQGSLTVKGGHIYNKNGQSSTVRNAGEGQAATLTIEGSAVIEHDCFIAVKNDDLGILTINGGEVVSKCPVVDGRVYPAVQNWGEATIRGGQVTGVVAVMTATWSDEFAASNTEITGNAQVCGQVKAHREATATVYPDVYVTGGRFTNYTLGEDTVAQFGYANVEGQHIFVSGGTYQQEVTREFLAEGYAYADGTVVVKTEADENDVAEVNGKFFTTLQSAVAAADSGATVTLLQDVEESITVGKAVTLNIPKDLTVSNDPAAPDHTITVTAGGSLTVTGTGTVDNVSHEKAAIFNDGGTVILRGGTITRSQEAGTSVLQDDGTWVNSANGNSYYTVLNRGEMEIYDGVTVSQEGSFSSLIDSGWVKPADAPAEAKASLTIYGGTFDGGKISLKNDAYGTMTVNGGTFVNASNWSVTNYGDMTIAGGAFTCARSGLFNGVYQTAGNLTVTGGTFQYEIDGFSAAENSTTAVSGGTFSTDVTDYCVPGMKWDRETHNIVLDEAAGVFAVAVANKGYMTLSEAIKAAKTGDTVKLLKDVEIKSGANANIAIQKKAITLDLNGHTASGGYLWVYGNDVGLTVEDNSEAKTGKIAGTDRGIYVNGGNGTVAVTGGTVESSKYGIRALSGTVNVTGGTVSGDKTGIFAKNATVNLTGGTVSGVTAVDMQGGTINISDNALIDATSYGISLQNVDKAGGPATLTMTGGTVRSNMQAICGNNVWSQGTSATISGGTVTGGTGVYWPMGGTLTVSGNAYIEGTLSGIEVKQGTVNIQGGTIKATGEYNEYTPSGNGTVGSGWALAVSTQQYSNGSGSDVNSDVVVNITGGTIESVQGTGIETINMGLKATNGTITISDATVKGAEGAIHVVDGADVIGQKDVSITVKGGTYSSDVTAYCVSGKAAFLRDDNLWHIDIDTTKSARIGETYYDGLDEAAKAAAADDTIVVVKDTGIKTAVTILGTLDPDGHTVTLTADASLTVTANSDVSDCLTFDAAAFPVGTKIEVTEANGTFTYKLATPVARVGDEYFSTLQAAIDASNGAEVTLLVDHSENVKVAENQTVVLDLGGKTLSAKDTTHDAITSQGDLTVKNGTVRATGRNSAAVYADKGTVTVADSAVLTGGYGVYSEGADLTITAGRVEGRTALYLKKAAAAISGTAVLSSTGNGTPAMELSTNAVVTISGGTFNGAYAARGGSVTVTGGTFNSVTDKYFDCAANVTGGTFRNDMGKEIAEGYLPVRLENGWYSVVEGTLAISQATATLYSDSTAGNTVTLTVTPANAAGLTWTSDYEEVATVNAQGVVTAVANGTATVTAAISNGDTVSCVVTVTNAPVYVPGDTTINDQDVPLASVLPFDDVAEEQWFYDAVKYAYENELMAGITDNLFDPQGSTTRGMIVTILYRLEGEPAVSGTSAFDDVADGQWYTDAVIWGTDNKVVAGYGDGTYRPTQRITREELAAILYRYATLKGYDVTVAEDAALNFSDADEVSAYARPAVLWCVEKGLINGMDDGTVSAGSGATRAQAAAILKSFCEQFADAE